MDQCRSMLVRYTSDFRRVELHKRRIDLRAAMNSKREMLRVLEEQEQNALDLIKFAEAGPGALICIPVPRAHV